MAASDSADDEAGAATARPNDPIEPGSGSEPAFADIAPEPVVAALADQTSDAAGTNPEAEPDVDVAAEAVEETAGAMPGDASADDRSAVPADVAIESAPVSAEPVPVEPDPADFALTEPVPAGAQVEPDAAMDAIARTGDAAAQPEEVLEIEVWRPARFERHQRPQGRPVFRPGAGRPGAVAAGAGQPGEQRTGQHRQGDRRGRPSRDGLAQPASGETPAIAAEGQPRRTDDRGPRRGDRDKSRREGSPRQEAPRRSGPSRDGPPREDRKPTEGRRIFEGRTPGQGRPQNRDDRGPRPERHDRQDRDRGGARAWSSEPSPGNRDTRQPDPNSPFAKLLALKEQMQGQKPEKGQ